MMIIKYKDNSYEMVSNNLLTQPWFDKSSVSEMIDIGYYESFFKENLEEMFKLIKSKKLKSKGRLIYIEDAVVRTSISKDLAKKLKVKTK
jgi:NADPH-dependent curcumin reductase CurA